MFKGEPMITMPPGKAKAIALAKETALATNKSPQVPQGYRSAIPCVGCLEQMIRGMPVRCLYHNGKCGVLRQGWLRPNDMKAY